MCVLTLTDRASTIPSNVRGCQKRQKDEKLKDKNKNRWPKKCQKDIVEIGIIGCRDYSINRRELLLNQCIK